MILVESFIICFISIKILNIMLYAFHDIQNLFNVTYDKHISIRGSTGTAFLAGIGTGKKCRLRDQAGTGTGTYTGVQ